jgi:flagella synthesis protein FlgN
LKHKWDNIVIKCRYLKKLNLENKVLLNKKIYLNQRFLELFDFHKNEVIYDSHGELTK